MRRVAVTLAALLTLIGAARIVATYGHYSQTPDEPAHIGAGMQLLDAGRYSYEPKHPPLPRVAVATGPFLAGIGWHGSGDMWTEGNRILADDGEYHRNLSLARVGTLPFYLLACLVVFLWARHLFGPLPAVLSVALFSQLPPILAHSGLATTDMALAATLPLALYALTTWLERPTSPRAAFMGVALALALVSKMSAAVFVPACAVAILAARWLANRVGRPGEAQPPVERGTSAWSKDLLPQVGLTTGTAFLVLFATYGFSVAFPAALGGVVPVPFPDFFRGFRDLYLHAEEGHPAYLLGDYRMTGWWYFFPVTLAIKTPLAFAGLAALGVGVAVARARRDADWRLLAAPLFAAVILAICMTSTINNGVRHVLPFYTLVAVTSGAGALMLWNATRLRVAARAAVASLALWLTVSSARVHPEYLPYFNELVAGRPERVVVNSDLCWGQDYFRLLETIQARSIDRIKVAYHGTLDESHHRLAGVDIQPLLPDERPEGWVAASIREVYGVRNQGFEWLGEHEPVARIGTSMWLYYIQGAST